MKVLIAGATGLIGGHLLKLCIKDSKVQVVHVVGRGLSRLSDNPKLVKHEVPFENLNQFDEEIDICFCCLGTTIKKAKSKEQFIKVDKEYPVLLAKRFRELSPEGKFLVVSAMGANPSSLIFYNRVKGEMENELEKMDLGSLVIVRPSLLLGERSEKRSMEGIGQKILPLLPLPKNYKAVKGERVAKKMLSLCDSSSPHDKVAIYLNNFLFE